MACYGVYDNVIKTLSEDHITCSSNTSSSISPSPYCCASGTTCVGNSICHFTPLTAKTSGYYIGSCTDESFDSPTCSRECSNHNTQHIVYDATSDMWACCYGSGSLDCAVPSRNETFEAPSPEQLTPLLDKQGSPSTVGSSLVVTSLVTSSLAASPFMFPSTVNSLPKASSTACPYGGSCTTHAGLVITARAGIGVGGSLLGVAVLVTIFLFIVRRPRRRLSDADKATTAGNGVLYVNRQRIGELDAKRSIELDSKAQVELPGSDDRVELA